jgi:hypothetical protein
LQTKSSKQLQAVVGCVWGQHTPQRCGTTHRPPAYPFQYNETDKKTCLPCWEASTRQGGMPKAGSVLLLEQSRRAAAAGRRIASSLFFWVWLFVGFVKKYVSCVIYATQILEQPIPVPPETNPTPNRRTPAETTNTPKQKAGLLSKDNTPKANEA